MAALSICIVLSMSAGTKLHSSRASSGVACSTSVVRPGSSRPPGDAAIFLVSAPPLACWLTVMAAFAKPRTVCIPVGSDSFDRICQKGRAGA